MKKIILKGTIVIAVFLAALFIISKIMNQGNTDMTVQMAEASFPVVTMKYDGKPVNELHGYDEVMEVTYMQYLKNEDTNELICRTETDSQTLKTLWLPKGTGEVEGGMDWRFGIGICTLWYME